MFNVSWKKGKKVTSIKNNDFSTPIDLFNENESSSKKSLTSKVEYPRILEMKYGESLGIRTKFLKKLSSNNQLGVGLPDLIHFTKFDKFRQEEVGEYHYITGIDISSEIMPIAYLNALKLSYSNHASTNDQVSMYCCTNIFSQVDIMIRYESEKHYQVTAVDCINRTKRIQINKCLWEETFVSGCIRSMIFNQDRSIKFPGLVEAPLGINNGTNYCRKIVSLFCRFLPRGLQTGFDSTKSIYPTFLQNYLVDALLSFLLVARHLNKFAIELLEKLAVEDSNNAICYKLVQISIMLQSDSMDIKVIKLINETMNIFFPDLSKISQHQLPNLMELLNLQVKFLIKKEDYKLALPLSLKSTELCSDNIYSWIQLIQCYIGLGEFEHALLSINSIPKLSTFDPFKEIFISLRLESSYYRRPLGNGPISDLLSSEYNYFSNSMPDVKNIDLNEMIFGRILMANQANRGYMKHIWNDACLQLGPVYGSNSSNLINFVSKQEIDAINDQELVKRSKSFNHTWSMQKIYWLLMSIIDKIGWNELLELRSEVFVMEKEHMNTTTQLNTKVKNKRMCEKWLDKLFMDLYDDLKISVNSFDHNDVKYNGLEWELLGLTLLRTWNWQNAIDCLRTSIMARFDIVSAEKILELYLNNTFPVNIDIILQLLIEKCSYESRFYDICQWFNLKVLCKLCDSMGVDIIRNRIFSLKIAEKGVLTLIDSYLDSVTSD